MLLDFTFEIIMFSSLKIEYSGVKSLVLKTFQLIKYRQNVETHCVKLATYCRVFLIGCLQISDVEGKLMN